MLFINLGFSLTTHYCSGQAVRSGLVFGQGTLDCGMNTQDCQTNIQDVVKKTKGCCEDHYLALEIEDDYNTGIQFSLPAGDFAYLFVHTYVLVYGKLSGSLNPVSPEIPPPLLIRDLPVLHQSFLI